MTEPYTFQAIGEVHSFYKEKFGIPRQPGLVKQAMCIEICPPYASEDAFRELDNFSHIWVIFVFHKIPDSKWQATVRPPRLGGNKRVGVFASRSMFRPNPIGLSVVKLERIIKKGQSFELLISGGDFVDGTPVLDIKPYLPYVDTVTDASSAYATLPPEKTCQVTFTDEVLTILKNESEQAPNLKQLLEDVLQFDPRPAYHTNTNSHHTDYGMHIHDFNIRWKIIDETVEIYQLERVND